MIIPEKKLSITTTNCSTFKAYLKKLIIEYFQYEPRLTEPIDELKKILHQYEECESSFNLVNSNTLKILISFREH